MLDRITPSPAHPIAPPVAPLPRDKRLRLVLRLAGMMRAGSLTLHLPDGSTHRITRGAAPVATITIIRPRAARRLAVGGSLGMAESWLDGDWTTPDLRAVMALAAANEAAWEQIMVGRPWQRRLARLLHMLRRNTRRGARRNIEAHYDLGNDFYSRWLDPSMTYSAALFEPESPTLEAAQLAKQSRLCQALGLQPGMKLLEIGCGWGSFATVAARRFGAEVHGITISPAQLEHATDRVARAGLTDRVRLALTDWRDTKGQFQRIASLEMIEAVGEEYWADFFTTLHDRLVPGGMAGLQVITIADRLFEAYRGTADFIQRHVFPGGMLPSPSVLREHAARAGLVWHDEFWFGEDYARTLAIWAERFQQAWPDIARLSPRYDERFRRLWEYYLAYCEAGFRAGWTDVGQIVLARPG